MRAALVAVFLAGAAVLARAEGTNAAAASPSPAATTNAAPASAVSAAPVSPWQRVLSFLPQADQDRVVAAHTRALADDPKLKAQEDALREESKHLQEANSADRMAFMEKRRSYEQRVRQAMLKEDPTLGPILDQIDQRVSAMRAQWEKGR
jgi:Skp family chaperone for outer membrane proteins